MAPKKPVQILLPDYMERFVCIGSECEDTCCAGWTVTIDKSTYKQYRNTKDKELSKLFDEHIKRNKTNPSDSNYAKFIMKSDLSCPFLNEEKLCSIQLKLGENYLSHTCQTYPRVTNTVDEILELSATLSCPEAARLALLNPNKMQFNRKEEARDNKPSARFSPSDPFYANRLEKYFWDLRIFTIQILQSREYKLWERLVILGVFYNVIQECVNQQQLSEIPEYIKEYTIGVEQGAFDQVLNDIPSNEQIQLTLLAQLLSIKRNNSGYQKRFIEQYLAFYKGVCPAADEDITTDAILMQYRSNFHQYYAPFMEQHEYILENYLVNYVFKNLFPYDKDNDLFGSFMMLIIHYSLLRILLIGIAGYHKDHFSTDHVVRLISSFAKTVEHNNTFLKEVMEYTKSNGYHNLSNMMILIKN